MEAHQDGEIRTVAQLLREDVRVSAAPLPLRYDGRDTFLASTRRSSAAGRFRFVATGANKQLAAASYVRAVVVLLGSKFRRAVVEAPTGFGTQPGEYQSDVIFLKLPLDSKHVYPLLKQREGVDRAYQGRDVLYFTRLRSEQTKSKMRVITQLSEYKSMTIRSWSTVTKLTAVLNSAA